MQFIRRWLEHPKLEGLSLDDPQTTCRQRELIRANRFVCQIYQRWCHLVRDELPQGDDPVLELGSGAGFMSDFIPNLITSDILFFSFVNVVLDCRALPFQDASLRAAIMSDVLHHVPHPRMLFSELTRCVQPGGAVIAIEPWPTVWSRFIFRYLHHEPFNPRSPTWEFPASGPLSGANGALPWILFYRDRQQFLSEFPHWHIEKIIPMMPFLYLLSGGVSMRPLMPGWTFGIWQTIERALIPWHDSLGMFALIKLRRTH